MNILVPYAVIEGEDWSTRVKASFFKSKGDFPLLLTCHVRMESVGAPNTEFIRVTGWKKNGLIIPMKTPFVGSFFPTFC